MTEDKIGEKSLDYATKELNKSVIALGRAMQKPNAPRKEIQDIHDKINMWDYIIKILEREAKNEQE